MHGVLRWLGLEELAVLENVVHWARAFVSPTPERDEAPSTSNVAERYDRILIRIPFCEELQRGQFQEVGRVETSTLECSALRNGYNVSEVGDEQRHDLNIFEFDICHCSECTAVSTLSHSTEADCWRHGRIVNSLNFGEISNLVRFTMPPHSCWRQSPGRPAPFNYVKRQV